MKKKGDSVKLLVVHQFRVAESPRQKQNKKNQTGEIVAVAQPIKEEEKMAPKSCVLHCRPGGSESSGDKRWRERTRRNERGSTRVCV